MCESHGFERLLETVGLIARHTDFPGKREVVERCRDEVDDLADSGVITASQGEILQQILLGVRLERAS